jgi:hypothetical protein
MKRLGVRFAGTADLRIDTGASRGWRGANRGSDVVRLSSPSPFPTAAHFAACETYADVLSTLWRNKCPVLVVR